MLDFLQNSWVVGIGGGIISGIIVYIITNWMYKRKDNSKYLEQINRANTDIIHALKPYVAEKGLPEKEIVDAIIVSTARKYKVKSEELYSIRIICEELIREIVENVYVSVEKKQEYSTQLTEYLHKLNKEQIKSFLISDIEKEIRVADIFTRSSYQRKTATTISFLTSIFAGIITTLLSALFVFFADTDNPFTIFENETVTAIVFVVIGITCGAMASSIIDFLRRLIKDLREDNDKIDKDAK